MARATRLAHLQAVPGEGIRVGVPSGPHVLLTPDAVRVRGVKDTAAGTARREDVPWERVRGLALRAPRRTTPPLGRRVLGWVGALLAADAPTGRSALTWVDGELAVALTDDDARPATWRFRVLAMCVLVPRTREAEAADALVERLAGDPTLRARLAEPESLLEEHRPR